MSFPQDTSLLKTVLKLGMKVLYQCHFHQELVGYNINPVFTHFGYLLVSHYSIHAGPHLVNFESGYHPNLLCPISQVSTQVSKRDLIG